MPANLQAGDLWRATLNGSLAIQNDGTRHFHMGLTYQILTVVGAPPTDVDLVNHVDANYSTSLKAMISNTSTYDNSSVRRLVPLLNRPVHQIATLGSGTGTAGTTGLAPQTSGLISLYTALLGRPNRGRLYFPFPTALDNQLMGIPSASYVGRLNAWGALMLADSVINGAGGGTATCVLVIYHRKTQTATPLTGFVARNVWATRRPRGAYKTAHR